MTNLTAPKTVYAVISIKINNSMSHVNDSTTSLNNFTNYKIHVLTLSPMIPKISSMM